MGGKYMIGYAVRKDGLGWRAATEDMVDPETEMFQVEQPPLIDPVDVSVPELTKDELLAQIEALKAKIESL